MTIQAGYSVIIAGLIGLVVGTLVIWLRQNDPSVVMLRREIVYLEPALADLANVIDRNTAAWEIVGDRIDVLSSSVDELVTALDEETINVRLPEPDQTIVSWPENEGTAS